MGHIQQTRKQFNIHEQAAGHLQQLKTISNGDTKKSGKEVVVHKLKLILKDLETN